MSTTVVESVTVFFVYKSKLHSLVTISEGNTVNAVT